MQPVFQRFVYYNTLPSKIELKHSCICFLLGMMEYIETTKNMVYQLTSNVQNSKDNVSKIMKLMAARNKTLFERKEEKFGSLLNLDDKKERLSKCYAEIKQTGETIHQLVQVNKSCLKICFSFLVTSLFIILLKKIAL